MLQSSISYVSIFARARNVFIFLFAVFVWYPLHAQNQNDNWYFGNEAAITFINGAPTSITTSNMLSIEGCASVSDPLTGELLFYTNGLQVWNKNNAIMPNGNGLASGGNTSATQGALIVPFPASPNKFYLFTVDEALSISSFDFRYSVIDMNLDNGLGDIISTQKNLLIQNNVTERLCVAKKADESGYWVMIHERDNAVFKAYELTTNGLNPTPIISNVGSNHSSVNQLFGDGTMGYMKFNHAHNKLAVAIYAANKIELFDFDNCTGKVSNPIPINTLDNPYGLEFSPDNSKLYYSLYYNAGFNGAVYQVNLLSINVAATNILVGISSSINNQCVGALQLGPDGKIYLAINSESWLSAITQPNNLGVASNFVDQFIALQQTGLSPSLSLLGLPQKVEFLNTNTVNPLQIESANFCFGDSTQFQLTDQTAINSINWNFGDVNSSLNSSSEFNTSHFYSGVGTYSVTAVISRQCQTDSLFETITIEDCQGNGPFCALNTPNILTPNKDGINDQFYFETNCTFLAYDLKIVNRWGNVVFRTQDASQKWDGTHKSQTCSEGVYFYLLNYTTSESKNLSVSGCITLVN